MTKVWTHKVPPTMVVSVLQFQEGHARYKHLKSPYFLPGLGLHYPPQSWLYFPWGELLSQSRWRARAMVRMPPTHTPAALVLAFHFRCYTTDKDKRWEHCDAPICSKFSYTYLNRKVFCITYPARRLQRWSFIYNDGMVMFFFHGTIAINGFSMVLPSLDHHHWMFL